MDLYDELLALIEAFDEANVDYALCGGMAVAFHGYARFTKDIDILVEQRAVEGVLQVVEKCGFIFRTTPMRFGAGGANERVVHRVSKIEGSDHLTLDVIAVTPILQEVWNGRGVFQWKERRITVVSIDGLGFMKRLAGRDRDLLDLKELGLEDDGEKGNETAAQDENG